MLCGLGLNPSKRIRCFSPPRLRWEPTNKKGRYAICAVSVPTAATGSPPRSQGQNTGHLRGDNNWHVPRIRKAALASSQNCSRSLGGLPLQPLKICRKPIGPRTAIMCSYFARENHLVLDFAASHRIHFPFARFIMSFWVVQMFSP